MTTWAKTNTRRFHYLLTAMGLLWLCAEASALLGISKSPLLLLLGAILFAPGLALPGVCLLYLFSGPTRRELLILAVLSALLGGSILIVTVFSGLQVISINVLLQGLGLSSLAALYLRTRDSGNVDTCQARAYFLVACLQLAALCLALFFLVLTIQICPGTYDALLYAADGSFGAQPSFVLGRLFATIPALALVAGLIYNSLSVAGSFIYCMEARSPNPPRSDIITISVYVAAIGYPIYLLFPVVGPAFAFPSWFPQLNPLSAEVMGQELAVQATPRNCMPSLHTTWALMVWWHARPLPRWVRVIAGLFLVFTLLATLGFGFHYLVDLVVAFPFAVAIQAFWTPVRPELRRLRWATILWGATVTALWLLMLRYGLSSFMASAVFAWTSALATVGISLILENALSHRATSKSAQSILALSDTLASSPAFDT